MYITSTGMACAVGLRAAPACAAIRAGIARLGELSYVDNQAQPIIGAAVPGFEPGLRQRDRLVELLSLALSDCLQTEASRWVDWKQVPLLVGLAEPERPGRGAHLDATIIRQVEHKLGVQFHPLLSHTIPEGHTAGFRALQAAGEILLTPSIPACLVCGVDSYLNARTLLWLEKQSRLKTLDNSDGIIPGEAAAAVLVERNSRSSTGAAVKVTGLGFGYEQAGILSEDPMVGLGLAAAFRAALAKAGVQIHEISFRIADVSGESYGFKEQAVALSRLLRVRREEFPIWHCVESIGDTGAAAGICEVILAFHAFLRQYAPGDLVLCSTSSVPGHRAALVLQRQDPRQ